jgi:hypothetical protein
LWLPAVIEVVEALVAWPPDSVTALPKFNTGSMMTINQHSLDSKIIFRQIVYRFLMDFATQKEPH